MSYLHKTEKKALNELIRTLNSQIHAMEMERSQAINELESKLKATNGTILFHKTQWTRSNKRVKATQSLNELNATKPKMDLAQSHNALLEKEEQLKTASAAVGHLHLENESLKRKLGGSMTQSESFTDPIDVTLQVTRRNRANGRFSTYSKHRYLTSYHRKSRTGNDCRSIRPHGRGKIVSSDQK